MSLLSNITAFGKRLGRPGTQKHLDPARDWLLLLLVLALFLVASIAWNAWYFFVALDEESANVSQEETQKLDTSALERARALYDTRAAEEVRYRTEYRFIDPSR